MIKLDIIAGFLGAGKTTFINRLLAEAYAGETPVLIENEFGEVSIDDNLIEDPQVQIRLLSSGCICCTLKGDFIEGLTQVVEEYSPTRVIIEPTGLADPADVLSACQEVGKTVPLQLNAFITLTNAENLLPLISASGLEVFKRQIAGAKLLVLNRTSNVDPNTLNQIINAIRELSPACTLLDQDAQKLDTLTILTMAEQIADHCDNHGHDCKFVHPHDHEHHRCENSFADIRSLAFFPEKAYIEAEVHKLFQAFSGGNCGQVLRAKGFLRKAGGGYTHLEYVYGQGRQTDSTYSGQPRFVVIGNGLDKPALSHLLVD